MLHGSDSPSFPAPIKHRVHEQRNASAPEAMLQTALQLSSSSDYRDAVLDDTYHDGPVAYWRLGENSHTSLAANAATSAASNVGLGDAVAGTYVFDTGTTAPVTRLPSLVAND